MEESKQTRTKQVEAWIPTGIFLGAVGGVLAGFFFGKSMESVAWVGDLFLNALKMLIIPLVVLSVISGIVRMGDIRRTGRLGVITLLYYGATTAMAVFVGLLFSNLFLGGEGAAEVLSVAGAVKEAPPFSVIDLVLSLFPPSIIHSMAEMEILPVIVFSLLFGGALSTLGERGRPLGDLFLIGEETVMKMVHVIFLFAPVGIFALIAGKLAATGGGEALLDQLWNLRWYVITVVTGLSFHSLLVIPLLLYLLGKRDPFRYARSMFSALLTAFSTASSSATLPVTMEAVEEKNGVSGRVSGFVLPLGATVNMDGTALYEAVAALFIAQIYQVDLGLAEQAVIFVTATLAAIGAAGIPEAGLVTMVIVLQAVHLPVEGIALLLSIDWFLDRIRTTVNVWGDSAGAAIIEQLLGARVANGEKVP